jgi:hypothetical protein
MNTPRARPPRPTKPPGAPLTGWYLGPFPLDCDAPLRALPDKRMRRLGGGAGGEITRGGMAVIAPDEMLYNGVVVLEDELEVGLALPRALRGKPVQGSGKATGGRAAGTNTCEYIDLLGLVETRRQLKD